MGLLDELLGGGQQRERYQDFASRYDQGPPYEGISDDEAIGRYQELAPHLDEDTYRQSAYDSVSRMAPGERVQFGQYLRQQAQQQGIGLPGLPQADDHFQDPGVLAQLLSGLQRQQPGGLGTLLGGLGGGGGSGMLGNPLAKAGLAGITAMAARRLMGGR